MNARESQITMMSPQAAEQAPLRAALLGNPNCGKTALFNLLTGAARRWPTTRA